MINVTRLTRNFFSKEIHVVALYIKAATFVSVYILKLLFLLLQLASNTRVRT